MLKTLSNIPNFDLKTSCKENVKLHFIKNFTDVVLTRFVVGVFYNLNYEKGSAHSSLQKFAALALNNNFVIYFVSDSVYNIAL